MEPRRPRAWIAFLLAANLPGWGHFYVGSLSGVLACLALVVAGLYAIVRLFGTPFDSAWPIAITFLLVLAILLVPSFHAARIAARRDAHWISGRWRRIGACVAYLLAIGWLIDTAANFIARSRIDSFHIPSHAMHPTLIAGDYVVADVSRHTRRHLERGQVVVYAMARENRQLVPADQAPDLPRERFVKRLIGLPGDHISLVDDKFRINEGEVARHEVGVGIEPSSGRPVVVYDEELGGVHHAVVQLRDPIRRPLVSAKVEPDRIYVMGDNRDNSNDSRYAGTTHVSDVLGVVTHIYFSRDPETGEIRWARIGRVVR